MIKPPVYSNFRSFNKHARKMESPRKKYIRYIKTEHKFVGNCKTKKECSLLEYLSIPITDTAEIFVLPVDVGGETTTKYVLVSTNNSSPIFIRIFPCIID